jgi:hypothetical protein
MKLRDLKYDGEYVFPFETREFFDGCDERAIRYWNILKIAESLADSELEALWMDCAGTFECSHSTYESPIELLNKAGPLADFLLGYGMGIIDAVDE